MPDYKAPGYGFLNSVVGECCGVPFKARRADAKYMSKLKLHKDAITEELRFIFYSDKGAWYAPPMTKKLVESGILKQEGYINSGIFVLRTLPVTFDQDFQILNIICADLIRQHYVRTIVARFPIPVSSGESVAFEFQVPRFTK